MEVGALVGMKHRSHIRRAVMELVRYGLIKKKCDGGAGCVFIIRPIPPVPTYKAPRPRKVKVAQ